MSIRISFCALAAMTFVSGAVRVDDKPAGKDAKQCCKGPVLRIGAVAYSPDSVTIFRGMRHYFAKNGMPMEYVLYSTYDELGDALEKKQVDIAWNSPQGH